VPALAADLLDECHALIASHLGAGCEGGPVDISARCMRAYIMDVITATYFNKVFDCVCVCVWGGVQWTVYLFASG
jgi:hypothetical protein